MTWTEANAATFRAIAAVAVPRRDEMVAAIVATAPFDPDEPIAMLDLGCGDGTLSEALLKRFPRATLTALDGSESMRAFATPRLQRFGDRVRVADFDLTMLDWWDRMFGAHLIVSSLCLRHLNDAKKRYLYKAAAERMSATGAFVFADVIEPQHAAARALAADRWDALAKQQADALRSPDLLARFSDERWNHVRFPGANDHPSAVMHHLVWLRHAGFADVDCVWLDAGHAVIAGFKRAAASAAPPPADN
jgi:tRNA (cmo5U34)-methyltransferase